MTAVDMMDTVDRCSPMPLCPQYLTAVVFRRFPAPPVCVGPSHALTFRAS
jgi:hypothetical protein